MSIRLHVFCDALLTPQEASVPEPGRSQPIHSLLDHLRILNGYNPRLAIDVVILLHRERIHPDLGVSPLGVRVDSLRDVSQAIPMRHNHDLAFGARTQPLAVPSCACLECGDVCGVEALFAQPVGGECAEV